MPTKKNKNQAELLISFINHLLYPVCLKRSKKLYQALDYWWSMNSAKTDFCTARLDGKGASNA
jgi:hypothetical protein